MAVRFAVLVMVGCSSQPTYIGSETCGRCHAAEYARWRSSHHAEAMQPATATTVLGEFDGTRLDAWQFSRRGDAFVVSTDGHDYTVAYTFGVAPLQQYLVAFPGGRFQVLPVAWDVGARRWFDVTAGRQVAATDWLHWTRPGACWNTMCADCHSTRVEKHYDGLRDRFATTFAEVSVGCEACHGPGSRHATGAPLPPPPRGPTEVERCAPCHARRAQLADHGSPDAPLLDRYIPVTLDAGVYQRDGQILDEDFEYQSFLQSKMYGKGVSCRDCHDVHSGALRASGNALCTRCHDAATFDRPAHHHHPGVGCVDCHMPTRTYMVVHVRRDHSLRVPQPDLGTSNACASCHADRPVAWVTAAYDRWFGTRPRARQPHWSTLPPAELAADPGRPAIARATAVERLAPTELVAFTTALQSSDPLIRYAAVARHPDPSVLAPLLDDPVRAVRLVAVARCAELPPAARPPRFDARLREYIAAEQYMADLPSGPYDLGNLYANLGRTDDAEREYRRALAIDDRFTPAKVNLAQLLARQQRNDAAAGLLRTVAETDPDFAEAMFDLGLLLAEVGKSAEAEDALRRSLAAAPDRADVAYNLAVLVSAHDPAEAAALFHRAGR